MFHVYLLVSEKDQRTYCGYTGNLLLRLQRHNSGHVPATKHRRPLKLLFSEEFQTVLEAKNRELWWKSANGRRKLKELLTLSPYASGSSPTNRAVKFHDRQQ